MNETPFDIRAVQRSFSRAASTYDLYSGLQRSTARDVAERLLRSIAAMGTAHAVSAMARCAPSPLSILDIGIGTGTVAAHVAEGLPGARVYGCDLVLPMLHRSREKLEERAAGLVAADLSMLPFADSVFDACVSSLAYQWAPGLAPAFSEVKRVLKPGGQFHLSTLGPGTLKELKECYKGFRSMGFRGEAEIEATLRGAGLEVLDGETRQVEIAYEGLTGLLKTLKYIGAAPPLECGKGLSTGRSLKEAAAAYEGRFSSEEGGVIATYEVIYISCGKGL